MRHILIILSATLCLAVRAQICASGLDNLPAYPLMEKVVYCAHDLTTPIGLCRYYYDKRQRLSSEIRSSYTSDTAVKLVREFRYNVKGQLHAMRQYELRNLDSSRITSTVFEYDQDGRHIGEHTSGRVNTKLEIQYESDRVKRRIESSAVWKYVMRFEYDSLGRLSRKIWDQGSFAQLHYKNNRLVRVDQYDRASTTTNHYHYADDGLLSREEWLYYDPQHYFGQCTNQVTVLYYSVH